MASGTSLLRLIKHTASAEITWMLRRFAGQDVVIPDDTPQPRDTLKAAIQFYRATWEKWMPSRTGRPAWMSPADRQIAARR